jgi:hypothetical protein
MRAVRWFSARMDQTSVVLELGTVEDGGDVWSWKLGEEEATASFSKLIDSPN